MPVFKFWVIVTVRVSHFIGVYTNHNVNIHISHKLTAGATCLRL